ncbi:MAG: ATP-dependent RecD-like DNA helicase [Lachnospiraceae bacterium]|nr:ATP-dependent RecD-like DNA helicase [Lachnospiraceae bacterium]
MEQNQIEGIVEHIIYRSPETGYTVLELSTEDDLVVSVGSFPSVSVGENLRLTGKMVQHPNYGEQFKADSFEVTIPSDALSMERYLGSGAIKGIGKSLAHRIVNKFGDDTRRILEEEPERLSEIKGISDAKARDIAEQTIGKKDLRDAMIFLAKYGINGNLAVKIFNHYHNEVYDVLRQNPYRLADEVRGIGFKTADEIAFKVGISVDSEFRIRSGIIYTLTLASGNGNTYMLKDDLYRETKYLLNMDMEEEVFETMMSNLLFERKIRIIDEKEVYLNYYYKTETECAGMLLDIDAVLAGANNNESREDVSKNLDSLGIDLDDTQKGAIYEASTHGVFVLTGGPGTGKTTTIKGLIKYFESEGLEVVLAAPTGRAAKRMSEATGFEARTIHRLLEVHGLTTSDDEEDVRTSEGIFDRNRDNPLEADVVIVDEMSMVDISVFRSLLVAMPTGARLILVGDVNQLPSVGPGNVLKDVINSGCFSVVKLEKVFRQAEESDIVLNAHRINNGEIIDVLNKSKDFFLIERPDAIHVMATVWKLVAENIPKYVSCEPSEIQVMAPMKKGMLGTIRLNEDLQLALNPPQKDKDEHEFSDGRIFRVGDKVMQTKNNYKAEWVTRGKYGIAIDSGTGVFNGDIGVITEIHEKLRTLTVMFDEGRLVDYSYTNLDELELAYAITIHKSQGSEYPAVIIPLIGGPKMLLNRNLLYTAVTRAKKCVIIVGSKETFNEMIQNVDTRVRHSGLKDRIIERNEKLKSLREE